MMCHLVAMVLKITKLFTSAIEAIAARVDCNWPGGSVCKKTAWKRSACVGPADGGSHGTWSAWVTHKAIFPAIHAQLGVAT